MPTNTKLIVGVDEAGYGPSIGPLTVCATCWRVPSSFDVTQMSLLLEQEIQARPWKPTLTHVPIGDSKKIHQGRYSVEGLILGTYFLFHACDGKPVADWDSRLASIAREDSKRIQSVPWYALRSTDREERLISFLAEPEAYFNAGRKKLKSLSIQAVGLRMRVLDEIEFNAQINRTGNKSTLLSEASLQLVNDSVKVYGRKGESVEVYCDKHGGRNRYQSVLSHVFDQAWFEIELEGKSCSRYSTLWRGYPLRIQFQVNGDSLFPSAAASIVAKWTREELMDRLNRFWQSRCSEPLSVTAGYYVDALRFAKQIEKAAETANLPKERWWRKK